MYYNIRMSRFFTSFIFFLFSVLFFNIVQAGDGAALYLEASSGKFSVNSTFTVSLYIDTVGKAVNAIEADLKFPPDKLQVISPATNNSLFSIWFGVPSYSNSEGTINLKGGTPSPGINTNKGLIATITFRVKSTGQAKIFFTDNSKVLANDGQATDILSEKKDSTFILVLPPPTGPVVSSPTHPDQNQWVANNNPIFTWNKDIKIDGFSYILDKDSLTIPDDMVDSKDNRVKVKVLEDGSSFFHIKARSVNGSWGGVSHYQVLIDRTIPAKFRININPGNYTVDHRPYINFITTDNASGIDYYDLKITPTMPLFIKATSPYQSPELPFGEYDVLIRAYDKAGNFTESKTILKIVNFGLVFWIGLLLIILVLIGNLIHRVNIIKN